MQLVEDVAVLKPRYYPYITVAAAVFLTLAPTTILFIFSDSDAVDREVDEQIAMTDHAMASPESRASLTHGNANIHEPLAPSEHRPSAVREDSTAAVERSAKSGTNDRTSESRIRIARSESLTTSVDADPTDSLSMSVAASDAAMRLSSGSVETRKEQPVPEVSLEPEVTKPAEAVIAQAPSTKTADSEILIMPGAVEPKNSKQQGDSVTDLNAIVPPVVRADHKTVTGHPFFGPSSASHVVPSAASTAVAATAPTATKIGGTEEGGTDGRKNRDGAGGNRRRSKSSEKAGSSSVSTMEKPASPAEGASARGVTLDPGSLIEDVMVQTPLETHPVNRVENVLAMTHARGWPVALIRSDIPGDDWWVQQMVGIQGNAFTARVNFGNEHSLSGGSYSMIFVFLDSAEEVRRFRIAKQFKELPEGTRRSREFHYVRN